MRFVALISEDSLYGIIATAKRQADHDVFFNRVLGSKKLQGHIFGYDY